MQTRDNSITLRPKRARSAGTSARPPDHGEPNPTWIPEGHEATRRIAEEIGGVAGGTWGDLFDVPMTAHFLGGCAIGDSADTGVIDAYHRVYGHPPAHRGRLRRLGQPGRQPVPDHHRPGRTRHVLLAEPL